jgi:putative intracellular protease/amidase
MANRILLIVTSHDKMGNTGKKTGFWLEELAAPYMEFARQGASIDIASPNGGRPPADPSSESSENAEVKAFNGDPEARHKLANTLRLADIQPDAYDAYFVVGGHGVMWDLVDHTHINRVLGGAFDRGRVIAAVCHGPAALVGVRLANGEPLVKGRRVAAFSNEEETVAKLTEVVPFALESKLRDLGAQYERGPLWASFAVRDGRLVTGQNPASSAAVARQVLSALQA